MGFYNIKSIIASSNWLTRKMTHSQTINKCKEHFEKQGYTCRKNSYPVFLDDENRFSMIDLVCFKKNHPPRAFEIESPNSQQIRNKKALEEFKRIFPKAKICQALTNDENFDKCGF